MRLINRLNLRRIVGGGLCLLTVGLAIGCHQFPNVFVDDLPPSRFVTTNSAYRARLVEVEPVLRDRGYELTSVSVRDGSVSHGPLWFEDGSDDVDGVYPSFDVAPADLMAAVIVPWRFAGNVVLLPITMVLHPPSEALCSDGKMHRRYAWWNPWTAKSDSQICDGHSSPIDVVETRTFREIYGVEETTDVDDADVDVVGGAEE